MYRYDNYTDSFVRVDGEPNTGSTTVRVGVPLKESVIVQKTELTDECIDRIADTVVRKLTDRKTEPQTDGILFKGNLKEGDYKLIKTTNGWVLEGNDIAYYGEPHTCDDCIWSVCNYNKAFEDEPQTEREGE